MKLFCNQNHKLFVIICTYNISHSIKLFFKVVLIKLELHRVFEHELVKILGGHAKDRGLFGDVLVIVFAFDDSLEFVLEVDEFEIVVACRVELDGPVLAHVRDG